MPRSPKSAAAGATLELISTGTTLDEPTSISNEAVPTQVSAGNERKRNPSPKVVLHSSPNHIKSKKKKKRRKERRAQDPHRSSREQASREEKAVPSIEETPPKDINRSHPWSSSSADTHFSSEGSEHDHNSSSSPGSSPSRFAPSHTQSADLSAGSSLVSSPWRNERSGAKTRPAVRSATAVEARKTLCPPKRPCSVNEGRESVMKREDSTMGGSADEGDISRIPRSPSPSIFDSPKRRRKLADEGLVEVTKRSVLSEQVEQTERKVQARKEQLQAQEEQLQAQKEQLKMEVKRLKGKGRQSPDQDLPPLIYSAKRKRKSDVGAHLESKKQRGLLDLPEHHIEIREDKETSGRMTEMTHKADNVIFTGSKPERAAEPTLASKSLDQCAPLQKAGTGDELQHGSSEGKILERSQKLSKGKKSPSKSKKWKKDNTLKELYRQEVTAPVSKSDKVRHYSLLCSIC